MRFQYQYLWLPRLWQVLPRPGTIILRLRTQHSRGSPCLHQPRDHKGVHGSDGLDLVAHINFGECSRCMSSRTTTSSPIHRYPTLSPFSHQNSQPRTSRYLINQDTYLGRLLTSPTILTHLASSGSTTSKGTTTSTSSSTCSFMYPRSATSSSCTPIRTLIPHPNRRDRRLARTFPDAQNCCPVCPSSPENSGRLDSSNPRCLHTSFSKRSTVRPSPSGGWKSRAIRPSFWAGY
jgi:hypothetical protein